MKDPGEVGPDSGVRVSAPVPCDRCGTEAAEVFLHSTDYISTERFDVLGCLNCGLLRTDFRGSADELARYYGPSYYGSEGRRFRPVLERATAILRFSKARLVARSADGPGRVLDLGCGRGLMLSTLRRWGWECSGTEVSRELADAVRRREGFEVIQAEPERLPFPDGHFDVVTAWHSIEHMDRPVRTLGEALRVLKPGGLLIVEIPNASSLQALLGGGRWFHLDVPRHLYHFSRENFRDTLSDLGFMVRREGTLSLEQGPYGMLQTLLNRLTLSPNLLYRWLKNRGARESGGSFRTRASRPSVWDIGVTLALALPLAVLGAGVEFLACLVGRGGVIRVVASKAASVDSGP